MLFMCEDARMANGTVLKTVVLQGTGGSNPSLRANTNIF